MLDGLEPVYSFFDSIFTPDGLPDLALSKENKKDEVTSSSDFWTATVMTISRFFGERGIYGNPISRAIALDMRLRYLRYSAVADRRKMAETLGGQVKKLVRKHKITVDRDELDSIAECIQGRFLPGSQRGQTTKSVIRVAQRAFLNFGIAYLITGHHWGSYSVAFLASFSPPATQGVVATGASALVSKLSEFILPSELPIPGGELLLPAPSSIVFCASAPIIAYYFLNRQVHIIDEGLKTTGQPEIKRVLTKEERKAVKEAIGENTEASLDGDFSRALKKLKVVSLTSPFLPPNIIEHWRSQVRIAKAEIEALPPDTREWLEASIRWHEAILNEYAAVNEETPDTVTSETIAERRRKLEADKQKLRKLAPSSSAGGYQPYDDDASPARPGASGAEAAAGAAASQRAATASPPDAMSDGEDDTSGAGAGAAGSPHRRGASPPEDYVEELHTPRAAHAADTGAGVRGLGLPPEELARIEAEAEEAEYQRLRAIRAGAEAARARLEGEVREAATGEGVPAPTPGAGAAAPAPAPAPAPAAASVAAGAAAAAQRAEESGGAPVPVPAGAGAGAGAVASPPAADAAQPSGWKSWFGR